MPFLALDQLKRRQKQLDTLRNMLAAVDAMLAAASQIATERELTGDEHTEVAAIEVRRDRLQKSISEAGG